MKNVIIIRGVGSSGKSSFAELIAEPKRIVCADDYFTHDGRYVFDASKIGQAHIQCMRMFDDALRNDDIDNVVVANTNTKPRDYKYYVDEAKKVGARVTYVVLEKRHNNINDHEIPHEVSQRHYENLKNDLKLI